MNAKEIDSEEILHKHCNCEFSKQTGEQVVHSTLSSVQIAMESYYQARSKEEAGHRFELGKAHVVSTYTPSVPQFQRIMEAIRLAAFGKESENEI